jgi:flagellar basal body rod protein FlgC
MKKAICTLLALSLNAYATSECQTINELQLKMDAHASNYLNAETTRTPEGGAYKYKKVVCSGTCKVQEVKSFFHKYLPNHPDADTNGYVSFPQIDKEAEKGFISAYAKSLVMVSKACPTAAKVLEIQNGPAALMTYKSGNIISDTINFMADGSVISWVRQTKNGESKILNL